MKKILLVGGCGFIGHNLSLYLKKQGHYPVVVDSLAVNNIYSLDNLEIKNQKLYKSILENRVLLLKKNKIDLIIQDARNYDTISKLYIKDITEKRCIVILREFIKVHGYTLISKERYIQGKKLNVYRVIEDDTTVKPTPKKKTKPIIISFQ